MVADSLGGFNTMGVFVQGHVNLIVDLLLPVFMARLASRIAIDIRRGQHFVELAEFVFVVALGLLYALRQSTGADSAQQADKRQFMQGGKCARYAGLWLCLSRKFRIDHRLYSRIAFRLD